MEDKNAPHYVTEDAAKVIYDNISPALRGKLSIDQIGNLLDISLGFYEEKGLIGNDTPNEENPFIDINELNKYILDTSSEQGFNLSSEEVNEILDAEVIYMKQIGIIDEE